MKSISKHLGKMGLMAGLLGMAIFLSACTAVLDSVNRIEMEHKINSLNKEGYALIDRGEHEAGISKLDEAVEWIYRARPELENLSEEVRLSEIYDAPFNNLSWAYNELGEYEKSLEAIEKSLLILPNTDAEYVNKGNTLYKLYRYDEALESYNRAIGLVSDSRFAWYGKGLVHYDREQYQLAVEAFAVYYGQDPSDPDVFEMLGLSYLGLGDYDEARGYANKLKEMESGGFRGFSLLADVLEAEGDAEGLFGLLGDYRDSGAGDVSFYAEMIRRFGRMGDLESAKNLHGESTGPASSAAELHAAMGDVLTDYGYHREAVGYYELAIAENPRDPSWHIGKLKALYYGSRYLACAEFGEESLAGFADEYDVMWWTGQCLMELSDYGKAADAFSDLAAAFPEDDDAHAWLAYARLMLGEREEAERHAKASLDIYAYNDTAKFVLVELEARTQPLGRRIAEFFRNHYLYEPVDPEGILDGKTDGDPDPAQVVLLIDRAKRPEDPFTFMIYGEEYDLLAEDTDEEIVFEMMEDAAYFRILWFDDNTDDLFIRMADEIPEPETKALILDLRGNGGGDTDSANRILDALLPEMAASMLIDKYGYTTSYYSDASRIPFREAFVLVDEETASAAELLTLGLDTYFGRVTIVGRPTFGKGVGQMVFDDPEHRVMVYVVNHYWNVRQRNVADSPIVPDIAVYGRSLDQFMKPVLARLKSG